MKKIDVGQALQILANTGVIAGIVFLGVELQQNNELMEAERRYNRLTISTGTTTLLATHPELAAAVAKMNDRSVNIDDADLTPGEQTQLRGFYARIIFNQQWSYLESPESELPLDEWRRVASRRGWQIHWEALKRGRNKDFVSWMEENVLDQ